MITVKSFYIEVKPVLGDQGYFPYMVGNTDEDLAERLNLLVTAHGRLKAIFRVVSKESYPQRYTYTAIFESSE